MGQGLELAIYRVVQESLTNMLKHAGSGRAELTVEYRADLIMITADSPSGGHEAPVAGSGAGLIGMRERAVLLGGRFAAGVAGGRWRVDAELPIGAAAE